MKNLLYSLLVVFTLVSCSKDDPTPSANVEGKWNLSTASIKMKAITGDTDEDLDYKGQGLYIDLKDNGKFSSNLVMGEEFPELLIAGNLYESDYEVKGDELILKIYDDAYEEYIPVKLKVKTTTSSQLVLQLTKAELAEIMQVYDELDETNMNTQMLAFITSLDVALTFSK